MRVLKIVFCLCFIYTSCIGYEWTLQESVDYWCLDDAIVADYYVDWWGCEDQLYYPCLDWEYDWWSSAEECVDETHYAWATLEFEPWTLQESVDYWCLDDAIVFDYYIDQWDCDEQLYYPCLDWEYDGWWSAEECVDETHYDQLGFTVWTLQESVDWWCLDESIISKYYIDWNDCNTYLTNECEQWEFTIYWSAEECVDETHFEYIEWFDDDSDVWTLEESIDYWCDDNEILDTFYPSGYDDCYDFFDTACFNWEYDLIYTSAETCVDETHFDFAKVVDGTSSGAAQLTQSNSDVELPGSWSALGAGLDGFFGNGDVLKSFYLGVWLTCFIFKM